MRESIRYDENCRICGGGATETVLELTPTPPADAFVPSEKLGITQDVYPLEVALCDTCGYVYLPYVLSPDVSYQDYIYLTETTVGLEDHYQEYASQLVADLQIKPESLVLDVGSNDGTMLEAFSRHGVRVLGVEPSPNIAAAANERGRKTLCRYFTSETASRIAEEYGKAAAVTANYVYANVDDLLDFTNGVSQLLAPEGVFVIQTGYHPDQIKRVMFDYIYHEHFSYFSVKALAFLLARCGLELIKVHREPHKGGSIRAYAQHKGGCRPIHDSVATLIEEERRAGIHERTAYDRLEVEITQAREHLDTTLRALKEKGTRIVGYGASHSTTTLMYHFRLGSVLDYLVDDNPLKQGLFSPGLHLPVHSPEKWEGDPPACAVILAWQHTEPIVAKAESLGRGRQMVVPLPKLRMIDL